MNKCCNVVSPLDEGNLIKLSESCGSNAFKGYYDDAKESRVKQIPKIQEWSFQESSFKNQDQDSRLKIQESRKESIKISIKKVFQNIE